MSNELGSAVVLITGRDGRRGKSTVASMLAARLPRAAPRARRRLPPDDRVRQGKSCCPTQLRKLRPNCGLRYQLSVVVADEYARHGWTAVVQDIILGADLGEYVSAVNTRPAVCHRSRPFPGSRGDQGKSQRPKTGYGAWTVDALDQTLREEDAAYRVLAGHLGADARTDSSGDPRQSSRRPGPRQLSPAPTHLQDEDHFVEKTHVRRGTSYAPSLPSCRGMNHALQDPERALTAPSRSCRPAF